MDVGVSVENRSKVMRRLVYQYQSESQQVIGRSSVRYRSDLVR